VGKTKDETKNEKERKEGMLPIEGGGEERRATK
jgi:hypothetical protein